MPYITEEERSFYDCGIDYLVADLIASNWNVGHVNYVFTSILKAWWESSPGYATICSIKGTLACVASEFYRRVAIDYEEKKIKDNGDVF